MSRPPAIASRARARYRGSNMWRGSNNRGKRTTSGSGNSGILAGSSSAAFPVSRCGASRSLAGLWRAAVTQSRPRARTLDRAFMRSIHASNAVAEESISTDSRFSRMALGAKAASASVNCVPPR